MKRLVVPSASPRTQRCAVPGASSRRAWSWNRPSKTAIALIVTATLLVGFASIAAAALTQHGDLFLTFNGDLSPTSLPRHNLAPISVSVSGTVRTPPGTKPPPLRQIEIELNRDGRLETTGLPICHAAQLEGTTSAQALAACRDALVGSGAYAAQASFPEQATFPAQGHILAFNGLNEGRQVILAHIYGTTPVPGTSVMTFYIHHPAGAYGTQLIDNLPPSLNHYGYVKRISLTLHRTYAYRGRLHSYLSAACSAPAGLSVALFPFAHAAMRFEGGVMLASTLIRSCKVRK